jgi:phage baseplate assembly protein gpV
MEALHDMMAPQTEQARKRLVQGLVTAKVRSREDDGTYLLDYLTMGSNEPSAPARVMMPMAGGKRGTYFFPELGDEVVVAFELGDTNFPVILGAVWNQDDPFPDQAQPSSQNNVRTIVSRSGHQLTFDDTSGAKKITIKTQGGHELVMDDSPPGKITLASKGNITVALDDSVGQASITSPSGTTSLTLSDIGITLSTPAGSFSISDAGIAVTSLTSAPIALTTTAGPIALTTTAGPILLTTASQPIILFTTGQTLIPPLGSLVQLL